MNTPAIHHALRLMKQPEEMAWLCYPDSDLPEGVTDLLRVCSSTEQLNEFATKNNVNAEVLASSLLNFIKKAIVNENNSDVKILGSDQFSSLQLQSFHYELLMKIFSDDTHTAEVEYANIVSNAYQRLQQKDLDQEVIRFSEYRKSSKNYYHVEKKEESTHSLFKSAIAIVSAIGIFTLVSMAGKNSHTIKPELLEASAVKHTTRTADTDNNLSIEPQKLIKISSVKSNNVDTDSILNQASKADLHLLLKDLEHAYEMGDVQTIMPILANAPEIKKQTSKQLNDKLETLFEITSERKMLLFDFDWKSFSGKIEGKGKFLSRYQLVGEKDWITREGNASVTAQLLENKLMITQLILDNPVD